MYIPRFNRIDDRGSIIEFIQAHGFATLVSNGKQGIMASHLPVLWNDDAGTESGILRSHMARANPQWHDFESGEEILVLFHGPHAYISPSWYVLQHTVPTWNYAVVHAYGVPQLVDEYALRKIVEDTTAQYESNMPQPWKIPLTEDEIGKMLKVIVGFSIRITRIEAKFKLGQNRSAEDQQSMLRGLEESGRSGDAELARFILEHRDAGTV